MASRLSEYALKEVYDSGLRGLPWKAFAQTTTLLGGRVPVLKDIMALDDAELIIKSLEPLDLYRAIKSQGVEDHLEVLPLMSEEQHIRIMDYEAWQGANLVPERAFSWLKLFREVSHEEFFGRFKSLDEEYQLALLSKFITVIEKEEHEKLGSADQDLYTVLPCNELYYRVISESPQTREFIEVLIQSGLIVDLPYTYSLMTHSSFIPPNEDEQKITQFRRARLEEDGFVDAVDARAIFVPLTPAEVELMRGRYTANSEQGSSVVLASPSEAQLLIDIVLDQLKLSEEHLQRLAHTVNTVAAAAGIAPDEIQSLDQVVLLVKSVLSLALDDLANGDSIKAAEVFKSEHPTHVLRYGFALAHAMRTDLSERLAATGMQGVEALPRLIRAGRLGEVMFRVEQYLMPVLGLDSVEYLKGAFNRFPMAPRPAESGALGEGAIRVVFEPVHSKVGLRAIAAQVEGILEDILALREKMMDESLDVNKVHTSQTGGLLIQ